MTPTERDMILSLAPTPIDTVAVGESYYVPTGSPALAIAAAQTEHARRHGYIGNVLHTERLKANLFEVVLATSERVEEGIMTDLAPEQESESERIFDDYVMDRIGFDEMIAAIEAAAIARDREALVEVVARRFVRRYENDEAWASITEHDRDIYRRDARRLLDVEP